MPHFTQVVHWPDPLVIFFEIILYVFFNFLGIEFEKGACLGGSNINLES